MLAWTAQGCCGCACRLAMLAWEQPSAGGCGGCGASICCSYQCHVMLLFLSLPAHSARTIIPIDASIPVNATRCLSQRYSLLFLSLPCAVRALLFPLKLLFLSLPAHSTRNVIPIDVSCRAQCARFIPIDASTPVVGIFPAAADTPLP